MLKEVSLNKYVESKDNSNILDDHHHHSSHS